MFLVLSLPYYSGDVKNHVVWADSIIKSGPSGLYDRYFHDYSYPNYPPVAMWSFVLSELAYRSTNSLIWYLNTNIPFFPSRLVYFFQWENVHFAYIKLPAIISNIGIGIAIYLLFGLLKKNASFRLKIFLSALFLLNPASIYLSVIWGQIDTMPIMFLVFAIYFALRKSTWLTFISISLSLLSKQTVIIFMPIFLVFSYKLFNLKKILLGLSLASAIFYIAYAPFNNNSLFYPLELYRSNFKYVAFITSASALNFWGAISDFRGTSDLEKFGIFTYQQWGYLIFGLFFIPALLAFIRRKRSLEYFFHFLFLTTIAYFFILTRMHERYLIPVTIFGTLMLLFNKKYIFGLIFFTFLHFLNLYRGLYQPDMGIFNMMAKNIFLQQVLVLIYFLILIFHTYKFFKKA